ncbi:hypothetical protein DRJ22_03355 [Candidatus Woesearchaeota archaeon]|nr:MAG: hypothetical protein DRJ22_03355 [Candidatus Woesearchaeota archaeon]
MEYKLELDKAVKEIKKQKARKILIQLPDGLKPKAKEITDEIRKKTNAEVLIWLGSCYGACDLPLHAEKAGVDLLIQWGHSGWKA